MTSRTAKQTSAELLARVAETHVHFGELMEDRLQHAEIAVVERYLGVLASLVDKLEDDEKSLRQVAREMITESAAQLLTDLA